MRHEVPAAHPLIALITGLAVGPLLINPRVCIAALLICGFHRLARPLWFVALGIALALHVQSRTARETAAFTSFEADSFANLEIPLVHDWAEIDGAYVLRAPRFVANGVAFEAPVAVHTRFRPPEMAMEATLRCEGFLVKRDDREEYSASVKSQRLLAYEGELPRWHPRAWNRFLANRLERHAGEYEEEVALAQALVLGRGERLTPEMRESFRRGGTYHLLVFSGMQIAFAAGLVALLLRWLRRPRAADWLLLATAIGAPLFIGPTASVARASTGIALYALSRICKRPTSLENLWCLAALLRLIIEPRDLTDASFHLTYAGAGALLFVGRRRWRAALGAEAAITPLTLFHFHQFAIGGALLTFAMAPLIFLMLILGAAACAYPPALALIGPLHRLCSALNLLGISGMLTAPPLPAMLVAAFGALLAIALLRPGARSIAITLALLVPTAAAIARHLQLREVAHPRVTFLDVGQGDAIALRSGTQTMLVDGGRDRTILRVLAEEGVRKVETIVLSHAHPDHCGGLAAVIEQMPVGRIYVTPRKLHGDCARRILAAASHTSTPIHFLRDGQTLLHGAFRIDVHLADRNFRRSPENNASVVLRATAGSRSFLLTGDIEKEAELTLADRDLRADVLKVPHHGSKTSTSQSLLDAVLPRIAVISCGRRNLFGHPHPVVLEALEERAIRVHRTDRDCTVTVEVRERRLYALRTSSCRPRS